MAELPGVFHHLLPNATDYTAKQVLKNGLSKACRDAETAVKPSENGVTCHIPHAFNYRRPPQPATVKQSKYEL